MLEIFTPFPGVWVLKLKQSHPKPTLVAAAASSFDPVSIVPSPDFA